VRSEANRRAESLFGSALALPSSAARARYLDEPCTGDPQLRGRVEELLGASRKVQGFLEPPVPPATWRGPPSAPARPSARATCSNRSARVAWAPSGWPSSKCRSSGSGLLSGRDREDFKSIVAELKAKKG
jgi:hypothetical protein